MYELAALWATFLLIVLCLTLLFFFHTNLTDPVEALLLCRLRQWKEPITPQNSGGATQMQPSRTHAVKTPPNSPFKDKVIAFLSRLEPH